MKPDQLIDHRSQLRAEVPAPMLVRLWAEQSARIWGRGVVHGKAKEHRDKASF